MPILKSQPITPVPFGAWWLRSVNLLKVANGYNLNVAFVPYNGQYTLTTTPARLSLDVDAKKAEDQTFSDAVDALMTEVQRQYSIRNGNPTINSFEIKILNVMAQNPDRFVSIFANILVNGEIKRLLINDVFGLAVADSTFATVLDTVINELGRQAKLAGKID